MKNTLIGTAAFAALSSAVFAQTVISPATFPGVVQAGAGTGVAASYDVVGDLNLAPDTDYIVDRHLFVVDGGILDIEEGAVIYCQPATLSDAPGNIFVTRDGRIEAQGAVDNPIIFTTAVDTSGNRYDGSAPLLDADPRTSPLSLRKGLWGAVTICGNAPVNMGAIDTGTPGEGFMEGVPSVFTQAGNFDPRVVYGGHVANDNSGFMQYVSIRYSGKVETSDNEVQGLTLGGVGYGTKLENIEIFGSEDDGIEVFGGTASIRKLVIVGHDDDGFDGDHGWTGFAQEVLIVNSYANYNSDHAIELDGDDSGDTDVNGGGDQDNMTADARPFASAHLANFTVIGFSDTDATYPGGQDTAVRFRRGFGGSFKNSLIAGFQDASNNNEGLEIDNIAGGITNIDEDGNLNVGGTSTNLPVLQGWGSKKTGDRVRAGEFALAGLTFWNVADNTTTGVAEDSDPAELAVMANTAPGAEGNKVADPKFGKVFGFIDNGGVELANIRANTFNPVPDPQASAAWGGEVELGGTFFQPLEYRGAFEPVSTGADLWTTGWTAFNKSGVLVSTN